MAGIDKGSRPAARRLSIILVGSMALAGLPPSGWAAGEALPPGWAAVLPSSGRTAGEAPASSPRLDNRKVVTIPVEGMVCLFCAATVKRTVKALDGVSEAEVGLLQSTVRVTYTPGRVSPDRVVSAIDRIGYKAGTPVEAP